MAAPEKSAEFLRRDQVSCEWVVIDGIETEGLTRYWELHCQAWETQ